MIHNQTKRILAKCIVDYVTVNSNLNVVAEKSIVYVKVIVSGMGQVCLKMSMRKTRASIKKNIDFQSF